MIVAAAASTRQSGKFRYVAGAGVRFKSTSIGTVAFDDTAHTASLSTSHARTVEPSLIAWRRKSG